MCFVPLFCLVNCVDGLKKTCILAGFYTFFLFKSDVIVALSHVGSAVIPMLLRKFSIVLSLYFHKFIMLAYHFFLFQRF